MDLERQDWDQLAGLGSGDREARERVFEGIRKYGLEQNVEELDAQGYTILPGAMPESVLERARAALLARAERQLGRPFDINTETDLAGMVFLHYMLYDDPVFEEILLEPKPLALITYLLGESCLLSSMGCHFRAPGGDQGLPIHADNANGAPAPFPPYSQVANINYALTPYSKEEGALVMIPGSHKRGRHPRPDETAVTGEGDQVTINLKPGDAAIWHGNVWHGSHYRQVPGVRMNLAVFFCRQYIQTQEIHGGDIPAEALARHADNPRFGILLGQKQAYGWRNEGPAPDEVERMPTGLFD